MKMIRFIPLIAIALIACSAPKYQYSFDHYTVTRKSEVNVAKDDDATHSPLMVDTENLMASASAATPPKAEALMAKASNVDNAQNESKQSAVRISKDDKKQLVQALREFRREMRTSKQHSATPHDQATQKLDKEVIAAIAFGAVGITLSLLGGISAAFWIAGVICLGVGVYFFIDWLQHR